MAAHPMASSVAGIERDLAELRDSASAPGQAPNLRTSVMTHVAWVPEEWEERAERTLAGLAERHPSRTILLFPRPDDADGLEFAGSVQCFAYGDRSVCAEVIRARLGGSRARHPASVVLPLLVADLPVFCRWRGLPKFDEVFDEMADLVDRLIVDSTEWPGLPEPYAGLAEVFDRVVVSDIAWARTSRWRPQLASLWPEIGGVKRIKVKGTRAQACLLAGWLRSRLGHDVELEHEESERLEGVDVDGEPAPFPPGDPPDPADLLSDELERFSRDKVYEEAVRAA
jgi:glucose-6-phosphate dehydrogenase assembly protein OpcA